MDADARFDAIAAVQLARGVRRIIATRGRGLIEVSVSRHSPTDAELQAVLLGPTKNLRAPSMRVGKTLLVGFHPESLRRVLDVT